jgi:hypothetical protein
MSVLPSAMAAIVTMTLSVSTSLTVRAARRAFRVAQVRQLSVRQH